MKAIHQRLTIHMKIVPLKIFKIKKDQMDLLKTKKVNT